MNTVYARETKAVEPVTEIELHNKPIREYIQSALKTYFNKLDGHKPCGLYDMVMKEAEQPLLETVMMHARGNQTRAAEMLGINRSTLRKKLKRYGLD